MAKSLPQPVADNLLHAANTAYINANTRGFYVSAAVMLVALVVALSLLPRRTRSTQVPSRHDQADLDSSLTCTGNEEVEPQQDFVAP